MCMLTAGHAALLSQYVEQMASPPVVVCQCFCSDGQAVVTYLDARQLLQVKPSCYSAAPLQLCLLVHATSVPSTKCCIPLQGGKASCAPQQDTGSSCALMDC